MTKIVKKPRKKKLSTGEMAALSLIRLSNTDINRQFISVAEIFVVFHTTSDHHHKEKSLLETNISINICIVLCLFIGKILNYNDND